MRLLLKLYDDDLNECTAFEPVEVTAYMFEPIDDGLTNVATISFVKVQRAWRWSDLLWWRYDESLDFVATRFAIVFENGLFATPFGRLSSGVRVGYFEGLEMKKGMLSFGREESVMMRKAFEVAK